MVGIPTEYRPAARSAETGGKMLPDSVQSGPPVGRLFLIRHDGIEYRLPGPKHAPYVRVAELALHAEGHVLLQLGYRAGVRGLGYLT